MQTSDTGVPENIPPAVVDAAAATPAEPTASPADAGAGLTPEPMVRSAAAPAAVPAQGRPVASDVQDSREDAEEAQDAMDDDEDDEDDDDAPRRARPAAAAEPLAPIRFADVVSGEFDDVEGREDVAPPKRVLAPQAETPKLHKVLAQAGLGSRLEMEQLIMEGRISVNNEPAHIGQRIQFGDQIKVNGKPIRFRIAPPPARVIAYHKPVGEVVTHDDPQNRPTVFRRLPRLPQGKWQSVGRLDLNTEGLLLFTNSGELANRLMHPRFGLEREYAVRVLGALSNEEKQRLLDGVNLDDGRAQFGTIEDGGGEGANTWYRVTIHEGRNREVRRLLESVGHAVSRLIRIRYGAMVLPRGLKRGTFMELDERDIRALMHAAGAAEGGERGERGERGPRGRGNAPGEGRGQGERRGGQEPGRGGRNRRSGGRGGQGGQGGQGDRPPMQADPLRTSVSPPKGGQGRRKDRPERGAGGGGGGGGQPDPMKTSLGYIGADSFNRQRQGGGGNGGGQGRGGPRRSGRR